LQDTVLLNAKKGNVAHAILLYGAKDAREEFAHALSKTLLCTGENKPCGVCGSCKRFEIGTHPDFIVLEPKKSKYIRVDDIRELIVEINTKPFESDKRVVYIKGAGTMNTQAQNALLKSLEEPPQGCVFILGVLKKDELLTTIISRCAAVKIRSKSIADTKNSLMQNGAKEELAHIVSYMSVGTDISATELIKDKKKLELRKEAIMACRVLYRSGGFAYVSKKFKEYIDNAEYMIDIMETVFRDMLVFACGAENIINIDEKQVIINGATYFTKKELLEILQIINALKQQLCYNVVKQLAVEAALLKMMEVKSS